MRHQHNSFADLASRVQYGDGTARQSLRHRMERDMVHIVRRSLLSGAGTTPLEQRILAVARRVRQETGLDASRDQEKLIRIVAQTLCASVITNLRPAADDGIAAEETFAQASVAGW